jgi:hypothetical protein
MAADNMVSSYRSVNRAVDPVVVAITGAYADGPGDPHRCRALAGPRIGAKMDSWVVW